MLVVGDQAPYEEAAVESLSQLVSQKQHVSTETPQDYSKRHVCFCPLGGAQQQTRSNHDRRSQV